jgi:hypothetical protein
MVTSAHRVEVEVGTDGQVSAPALGAAAGWRPGTNYVYHRNKAIRNTCRYFYAARAAPAARGRLSSYRISMS